MFTGLIREVGILRRATRKGGLTALEIDAPVLAPGLKPGDSVAVGGICLTVTAVRSNRFGAEAVQETRRVTTLGSWRSGRRLHLEPALRAGDALDGHLVQGHVDGVGEVRAVRRTSGATDLTVALPPDLARFLTPKGSVAVDGVSLTVDEGPFRGSFTVRLIPHTLQETCLGSLRRADRVNLEMDVLVKAAVGRIEGSSPTGNRPDTENETAPDWTVDRLRSMGFRRRGRG